MWQMTWNLFCEVSPWMLLGMAFTGLLHGLLPAGLVQRQLEGVSGVLKAVGLGIPMPLCSCGVIPAGIGLKRDGASDGAAVGFLVSTPQTGVDSILVSAAFLGWPFAIFKVFGALVTGLAAGILTHRYGGPRRSIGGDDGLAAAGTGNRSLRGMVDHAMQVLRTIWGWLVVGILVSAAIQIWVPTEQIAGWVTTMGAGAILAVLLLSVPLYVCATASVPIAAALVHAGVPTGAALVFLMAGPATNVATIGAVRQAFGSRVLGIYLSTIVLGSVALGLAFDFVLGTGFLPESAGSHHHTPWWGQASAVLIGALMVWFAAEDVARWWSGRRLMKASTVIDLSVDGMTCGGCVKRLEGVLTSLEGVETVHVQLKPGAARVVGTVTASQVRTAIEGSGFVVADRSPTTKSA
jgi:uncharacterized membrane protein YraQ (UPF0718 family)/copper chaperone CopZ